MCANEYYLTGHYRKTSGARVYPVEYTFDYAGRLGTMTTWQDYAGSAGAAVTQWKYEGTRGFLTNKVYQGTNGPGYTYTKAGRLGTRTWARGLTTSYAYNNAGELQGADYSDATPDVTYAYDPAGTPGADHRRDDERLRVHGGRVAAHGERGEQDLELRQPDAP